MHLADDNRPLKNQQMIPAAPNILHHFYYDRKQKCRNGTRAALLNRLHSHVVQNRSESVVVSRNHGLQCNILSDFLPFYPLKFSPFPPLPPSFPPSSSPDPIISHFIWTEVQISIRTVWIQVESAVEFKAIEIL